MNVLVSSLCKARTPLSLFEAYRVFTLQWRHNERDGVSNHQSHDCLLNLLFRRRSRKASKLRVTGLCERNSPVTGEFPAQRASNADDIIMQMGSDCTTHVITETLQLETDHIPWVSHYNINFHHDWKRKFFIVNRLTDWPLVDVGEILKYCLRIHCVLSS